MDQRGLGPVIIEDLVDFGHEQGLLVGARASLLDVLDHRGLVLTPDLRALIDGRFGDAVLPYVCSTGATSRSRTMTPSSS